MIGEIVVIDWTYWRIQPVIDLSSVILNESLDTIGGEIPYWNILIVLERTKDTNVGNWRIQPVTLIDCSETE